MGGVCSTGAADVASRESSMCSGDLREWMRRERMNVRASDSEFSSSEIDLNDGGNPLVPGPDVHFNDLVSESESDMSPNNSPRHAPLPSQAKRRQSSRKQSFDIDTAQSSTTGSTASSAPGHRRASKVRRSSRQPAEQRSSSPLPQISLMSLNDTEMKVALDNSRSFANSNSGSSNGETEHITSSGRRSFSTATNSRTRGSEHSRVFPSMERPS